MGEIDYERKYDEALAQGAAAVEAMQRKLDSAETLVRALIRASGGSIFVSRRDMALSKQNYDLRQDESLHDDGWTFSIRAK